LARAPDERVGKAYDLYKQGHKLVEIASQLNIPAGTVRRWKSTYKWDNERSEKKSERSHKKGPPKGNKNAVGNKGGAAPAENKNAEKHGFFSKWLPEETAEIMNTIKSLNPLDILWDNIVLQYAAIIRAQKIMYVTDKDEMIKEIKKTKVKSNSRNTEKTSSESSEEEFEYEFQFAWDRQATFQNAQSRAMSTLMNMIKQYDELLHKDWEAATEEQKARISLIKSQISKMSGTDNKDALQKLDEVLGEIKGVV